MRPHLFNLLYDFGSTNAHKCVLVVQNAMQHPDVLIPLQHSEQRTLQCRKC